MSESADPTKPFMLSKGDLRRNRFGAVRLAKWGQLRYGSHRKTAEYSGLHRFTFSFARARLHAEYIDTVDIEVIR